jgi:hypothetical protein
MSAIAIYSMRLQMRYGRTAMAREFNGKVAIYELWMGAGWRREYCRAMDVWWYRDFDNGHRSQWTRSGMGVATMKVNEYIHTAAGKAEFVCYRNEEITWR